jgi:hypothetical protein
MNIQYSDINDTNYNYDDINYNNYNYEDIDYNNYNIDSESYLEETPGKIYQKQKSKKKVKFEDILSNMNLIVNKKGLLERVVNPDNYYQSSIQPQYNTNNVIKQEPIDPSIKNSYIYNKYFKDYIDVTTTPKVPTPKTREEYLQILEEENMKRINEKQRISQIKSKKLFLTTNVDNQGVNIGNRRIQSTTHNLRKFSFG